MLTFEEPQNQTERAGRRTAPCAGLVFALIVPWYASEPQAGRAFDDCDSVSGDRRAHTVTWHGSADLGVPDGAFVRFRFRLRAARLYACEVVAGG